MSEVKAILLVPAEGDPLGLLADGVCGSRPPTAVRRTYTRVIHEGNGFADPTVPCEVCKACGQPWPCDTPGRVESEGYVRWDSCSRLSVVADALVLAWDGKPVAEGMDRAARCWEAVTEEYMREGVVMETGRGLGAYNLWWCRLVDAINLAHECRDHGLGTAVLLDADGKEIESEIVS